MPRNRRATATMPVLGAFVIASVLTGAAAFTVSQASCAQPGHYVQREGYTQLVGGCLDSDDFAPQQVRGAKTPKAGSFRQ
ncbi:MAG: hypothetical protein ACRDRL_29625 [Sciscionella sp.]